MLRLKDAELLRDRAYIDGVWTDGGATSRFRVDNPATNETIAQVADLDGAGARAAIEAASAALPAWSALTAKARAAILRRWFDLMMAALEDLAQLMTAEQGKPLAEIADHKAGRHAELAGAGEHDQHVSFVHQLLFGLDQHHVGLHQAARGPTAAAPMNGFEA